MIKLGINGACGRMGRRVGALARQDQGFAITTALEAPDCTYIDQDYGPIISDKPMGLKVTSRLGEAPEVIIDFSSPQSTTELVPQAIDADTRLVIGTTGLTDQHIEQLRGAAKKIPILQAANMSLGINLLLKLLGQVAQALGKDYDIEISETHHRFKKDAPSGTALAMFNAICQATGKDPNKVGDFGRHGPQALRQSGKIGLHAIRLGDTVGQHCVQFGSLGETVYLGHCAHSRDTFAAGALHAAKWIINQQPGLYSMQHVLFQHD